MTITFYITLNIGFQIFDSEGLTTYLPQMYFQAEEGRLK